VTTDANGEAAFSVSGSEPGPVDVVVNYESEPIDSATIQVTAAAKVVAKTPGRATIARLSALVGGFVLVVRAPASNGGSAITAYQYSVDGGAKWTTIAKRSTSIAVSHLAKGKTYRVIVRALNVNGAGASSSTEAIVTRK
jgi:hypothetical protein